MKKLFVAVVAVMMTAGIAANAQDAKKCNKAECNKEQCKEQCAAGECKRACPFEDLNLTDAQKEKIKELNAQKCQDRAAAKADKKADKKADRQARREAAKQARLDYLAQLKTILTPEQYAKYLENEYAAGGNHGKDMQRGHAGKEMKARQGKAGKKCAGADCNNNK